MKKLFAILLSALMLCTMIPFATVSAEEITEPTIWVSTSEANAGDEIQVEVKLLNNPGVIAATVEIVYDHDALELVTYYDEDEEVWMPQIEVGSGFNASSNKYITFGPIDDATGIAQKCVVSYIRGTAKSNCENEDFFVATFKVKDDAVSGTYPLAVSYDPQNFFALEFVDVIFTSVDGSVTINGAEPSCQHEYEYDCSKVCSLCGEESRPDAEHEYLYECDGTCILCWENTNPHAQHNILHVEAKEPVSCIEFGNVEYWGCEYCGAAWLDADCLQLTNLKSVLVAGECISNAQYDCQDGECINCGLPFAAEGEHEYTYACDKVCVKCGEITNESAEHSIVAVEAKDATCTEKGNVAYWYCETCGAAWLDEACTMVTNLKAVVLPMIDHVYDDEQDTDCNVCGAIREVASFIYGDANGDGKVNNKDLGMLQQHLNDWSVTINTDAVDVNKDGRVNNKDLGMIQQYLNDWDVTLG